MPSAVWRNGLIFVGVAALAGLVIALGLWQAGPAASRIAVAGPLSTPTPCGQIPNDDFENSAVIGGVPFSDSLSTLCATTQAGEPQPCAGIGATVWYSYAPSANELFQADTFGSTYDTALAIYTGSSLNSLTLVGCDDDNGGNLKSLLTFTATAATTYHFQVGGFVGSTGGISFNLGPLPTPTATPTPCPSGKVPVFGGCGTPTPTSTPTITPTPCPSGKVPAFGGCGTPTPTQTPCGSVPNDDFADSAAIGAVPFSDSLSTLCATTEVGEPQPCAAIGSTVWYSYTPSATEILQADTFGSGYDTALAVYTGSSLNSLALVGCDDDAGPGLTSLVTFTATAGTTYHFQVGGCCGNRGNLTFNLGPIPTPTPTPTPTPAILPGLDFSIGVGTQCDSTAGPTKCSFHTGETFTVDFKLNSIPAGFSYVGSEAMLNFTGVAAIPASLVQQGPGTWPSCTFPAADFSIAGLVAFACAFGINAAPSTYTGPMARVDFQCPGTPGQALTTLVGFRVAEPRTGVIDDSLIEYSEALDESLTINCIQAPTPTPTSTPLPDPRVAKLPPLQNVFLHRQGAKLPPARCEDGTDAATLNETIMSPITSLNPKDPSRLQQLGAFEVELRFDAKIACVTVAAGPPFAGPNAVCTTLTSADKGLVRFGCVTIGKDNNLNALVPASPLLIFSVKPQPELYSQIRPGQDNGIAVQILNQGCQLSDDQGLQIPIFSCEDADITFRFLEGDVNGPDCVVNLLDATNIAFRWGATKGNLLFNSFMDLSPTGDGLNGDGRIDIQDLQFVFGRLASTCLNPWPVQLPVNPKS